MRLHVLCEDEGSGLRFFELLRDIYCDTDTCTITSAKGKDKLLDKFKEICVSFKPNDYFLLAFDNIEISDDFNPILILNAMKKFCKRNNIGFIHTTYYCFEELFLSYSGICAMFDSSQYQYADKSAWASALEYVNKSINSGVDYYVKDNSDVAFVVSKVKYAGRTREKFAKALLTHVSSKIPGQFGIMGGDFGKCWLLSCKDLNFKNKAYICSLCNSASCGFCNKGDREKVKELENNSLCKDAPGMFSNVFGALNDMN